MSNDELMLQRSMSHGDWDTSQPGSPCADCGVPQSLAGEGFCTGRRTPADAASAEVMQLLSLIAEGRSAAASGGDLDVVFAEARPLVILQVDGLCAGARSLGPAGKKALRAMGFGPEAARRVAEALLGIFADERAQA